MPNKSNVLETKDYKIFKTLMGNRPVDKQHVKTLIRSMAEAGNLTGDFPVVVNEDMAIIDGQHRVEALKQLEWPVFYIIQPHLDIAVVRAMNRAQKNWSWKDYANSYIDLGNENYIRFMALHIEFGVSFNELCTYTRINHKAHAKSGGSYFRSGDMQFDADEQHAARIFLQQAADVSDALSDNYSRALLAALFIVFNSPEYDHARMVSKMEKFGDLLKHWNRTTDYLRNVEDIYNYRQSEDTQARLF